ncbi:MAG: hypothetical protein RRA94_15125 [Bacteroidota bacterium]|nr:hypothetical protein [Bacteroidota bacterium]
MSMLPAGSMLIAVSYRYGDGDTHLRGDMSAPAGAVLSYHMHYLDVSLAFGVHDRFTVEASLGAFPQKAQQFSSYTMSGSGMSHAYFGGKYLLLRDDEGGWEWNAGAGLRLPLSGASAHLPQHIDPSTGAFGASLRTHLLGSLSGTDLYLMLSQSIDVSTTNAAEYRYGPVSTSSLAVLGRVAEYLTLIAELRVERRWQDSYYGTPIDDSGLSAFVLTPQCAVRVGPLLISPYFDIPLYRYYYGTQLANDLQTGLHLIWNAEDGWD